jgi:hypothetical protein
MFLVTLGIADIQRRFGRTFCVHYRVGADGITFRGKTGGGATIQALSCRIITAENWVQTHDIP